MNNKELEKAYLELYKKYDEELAKNKILIEILNKQNRYSMESILMQENIKLKAKVIQLERKVQSNNKKKQKRPKGYIEFRKSILERDNYTCQKCGSKSRLQVHHIKSRKEYPELIMDKNNCITLCIVCHSKTDSYLN